MYRKSNQTRENGEWKRKTSDGRRDGVGSHARSPLDIYWTHIKKSLNNSIGGSRTNTHDKYGTNGYSRLSRENGNRAGNNNTIARSLRVPCPGTHTSKLSWKPCVIVVFPPTALRVRNLYAYVPEGGTCTMERMRCVEGEGKWRHETPFLSPLVTAFGRDSRWFFYLIPRPKGIESSLQTAWMTWI